jgi:DNA-directed RNA polymerase specialized sigma24 family protein
VTDETAFINQAQQGDEKAFTVLVEAYQRPVYNLCYRILGESESAEDATQETFLKVYQNLTRYDRSRSFPTWLFSKKRTTINYLKIDETITCYTHVYRLIVDFCSKLLYNVFTR